MNEWFWPQYTYVVIMFISFCLTIYKASRQDESVEAVAHIVGHLMASAFMVFILYKGGFF